MWVYRICTVGRHSLDLYALATVNMDFDITILLAVFVSSRLFPALCVHLVSGFSGLLVPLYP